jgi:hypothetical protein
MELNPRDAEWFRICFLQYHDWPEDEKRIAKTFALLIEIGLVSFDSETEILCFPTSKLREGIAEGLLPFGIEETLYFTQTPDVDLKMKPTEQGLMLVDEVDGKERLSPTKPFKFPSLEEFLGE